METNRANLRMDPGERGFSLLEVLITLVIGLIAFFGVLAVNNITQKSSHSSFETIIAMQDAHRVIERIRETATYEFFPDNVTNAFPSGQAVPGLDNLEGELVTVYYPAAADPLNVSVTVSWLGPDNRNFSYVLNSLITQRE